MSEQRVSSREAWTEDLGSVDAREHMLLARFLDHEDIVSAFDAFRDDQDRSIWNTFETSQAFTRTADNRNVPYRRRFQFVKMVGDPGSFGAAILVLDVTSADKASHRPFIVKIAKADSVFLREVIASQFMLENAINTNLSPNFVVTDSWFFSDVLPPWKTVRESLERIGAFRTTENRSPTGDVTGVFGYMVMEYASEGTFTQFYDKHTRFVEMEGGIDSERRVTEMLRSIAFQTVYILLAMQIMKIQHRDLAAPNLVLLDERKREIAYRKFKRRLVYTLGDMNFILSDQIPPLTVAVIDYSITEQIVREDMRFISNAKVRLDYRPPELLFVSRSRRTVVYMNRSDMFSAGASLLQAVTGSNFLTANEPPAEFVSSIEEGCMVAEWSKDKRNLVSRLVCTDSSKSVARYVWNLFILIGPPNDWDVLETSDLYRRALPFIRSRGLETRVPTLFRTNGKIFKRLGADGVDLVSSMMQWNPTKRPRAINILREHPFFTSIRSKRDPKNDIKDYGSRWGYDNKIPSTDK